MIAMLVIAYLNIRRWTGTERPNTVDMQADLSNVSQIGTYCLALLTGLACVVRRPDRYVSPVTIAFLPFFAWMYVVTLLGQMPVKGVMQLSSLLAGFLIFSAAMIEYGQRRTMRAFLYFQFWFVALSLAAFILLPGLATFRQWDSSIGSRITGLTSHPNGLGALCGLGIVSLLVYWRSNIVGPRFALISLGTSLLVLALTQSRTAIMATAVSYMIFFLSRNRNRALIFVPIIIVAVMFVGLVYIDPTMLSGMSRSGNMEEITSFTGRKYIWDYAIKLIGQSPVTGYGYGSTWYIFREAAPILDRFTNGYVFPHSHNLYLQIMLNGGIVALFLFLLSGACMEFIAISKNYADAATFFIYYLMYSNTESGGFYQYFDMYILPLCICVALINAKYQADGYRKQDFLRLSGGLQRA